MQNRVLPGKKETLARVVWAILDSSQICSQGLVEVDIIALSAKDGLYHSTARDGYNFMNSCSAEIFVRIFTAHCPYQTQAKLRKT